MDLVLHPLLTQGSKGPLTRLKTWLSRPRTRLTANRSVYDLVAMIAREGWIADGDTILDGWETQFSLARRLGLVFAGDAWNPFVALSSRGERFLATTDRAGLPE